MSLGRGTVADIAWNSTAERYMYKWWGKSVCAIMHVICNNQCMWREKYFRLTLKRWHVDARSVVLMSDEKPVGKHGYDRLLQRKLCDCRKGVGLQRQKVAWRRRPAQNLSCLYWRYEALRLQKLLFPPDSAKAEILKPLVVLKSLGPPLIL